MSLRSAMYLPQLTFLRFVAAMLVVFYHYGKQTFEAGYPFLHSIIAEGSVAVSFFFFLSGVVLGINYLGKPLDVRKFNFSLCMLGSRRCAWPSIIRAGPYPWSCCST